MNLNPDILYKSLSEKMDITRLGAEIKSLTLTPAVFFYDTMQYETNGIFIGQPDTLPQPAAGISCLIVCVGGRLPAGWNPKESCAFVIADETDILMVFNAIQETFKRFNQWSEQLKEVLERSASIAEMMHITDPILGNPIALCNNRLEIVMLSDSYDISDIASIGPVPEKYIEQFFDRHDQNTSMRMPFIYRIDSLTVYCINIFKDDTYLGLVSVGDTSQPFSPGDYELFCYFAEFVCSAAEKQFSNVNSQFVSLKSVLHDLLNNLPVHSSQAYTSLRKEFSQDTSWLCAAAKPTGKAERLPVDYLCALLEKSVPKSIALYANSNIALYISVHSGEEEARIKELTATLETLSLSAGVSFSFKDIMKARYYFRQAVSALDTASILGKEKTLNRFEDVALVFALRNSTGELPPEYMIPAELIALKDRSHRSDNADYWGTLKVCLDNEMNITQTAKDLFVHRTTLQARINKIRETICLESPSDRMYIRYCMYLYETFEAEINHAN